MPIRSSFGSLAALGPGTFHRGDMEHIATVTLGSAGHASFTSIPATYTHLQLRGIARVSSTAGIGAFYLRLNGDTGSNYAWHALHGNGTSAAALGYANQGAPFLGYINQDTTGSTFGAVIIDILDYANTSKNTTMRSLFGVDKNGSGHSGIASGLWLNTAAVTSIDTYAGGSSLVAGSSLALYGIRGA
jgi:hypothetical protein